MSKDRSTTSVADELEKLTALWNAGAITRAEFEEAKRQVLGQPGLGGAPTLPGPPHRLESTSSAAAVLRGHVGVAATRTPSPEPELRLPSGEMKLGNLHGREDPPPIPTSAQSSAPVIKRAPPSDAEGAAVEQAPAHPIESRESLSVSTPPTDGDDRALASPAVVGYPAPSRGPAWYKKAGRRFGPWILGAVVLGALTPVLADLFATKETRPGSSPSRGSMRISGASSPDHGRTRRAAQRRPGDGFSCQAFQDRIDQCESIWTSRFDGELRSKGIGLGGQRISVDQPRVAMSQAQALVFDSGGLHRCQAAQQRRTPTEQAWLKMVKTCMKRPRCRGFAACHVEGFLRYVGLIPFHCRTYCNREIFQCGEFFLRRTLAKRKNLNMAALTEAAFETVQPKLFRNCLNHCAQMARKVSIRQGLYECIFQPDCEGFATCIDAVPEEK